MALAQPARLYTLLSIKNTNYSRWLDDGISTARSSQDFIHCFPSRIQTILSGWTMATAQYGHRITLSTAFHQESTLLVAGRWHQHRTFIAGLEYFWPKAVDIREILYPSETKKKPKLY
ncbi:hypothetical protein AVEN_93136-1 [Araneus ventricosus]|uniref:Uncharacterized protein n=1 Tax=Araneus ventricosus TaxID=182803 RepID=A0A4Y2IHP3_ARAVE|nr:hypothetical protein AVEN_93136-1 [Araneus ventricosus]